MDTDGDRRKGDGMFGEVEAFSGFSVDDIDAARPSTATRSAWR